MLKRRLFQAGMNLVSATQMDRWLAPVARGSGVILMFHRILPSQEKAFAPNRYLEITPEFLESVIKILQKEGFEIVSLDEGIERLRTNFARRPFAVFTFDDAYRDNLINAVPVLRRYRVPWTVFVTTDFADGRGQLWWIELERVLERLDHVRLSTGSLEIYLSARSPKEKLYVYNWICSNLDCRQNHIFRDALGPLISAAGIDPEKIAQELCLGWSELEDLVHDPDVTIGAHSSTHAAIARQNHDAAWREIWDSKARLERRLKLPIRHFAFPYGDRTSVGTREFQLAQKAGFVSALTSQRGHLFPRHSDTLHALPRIEVNGLYQTEGAIRALLSGLPSLFSRVT